MNLTPHWMDLEGERKEYHGKCSADFFPFNDGNCYECQFWVDEECPYLKPISQEARTK